MRWIGCLSGIALALSGGVGHAQEAGPPPVRQEQPTALDDVVVQGAPLEQQAFRFTEELAANVPGRGLARWAGPVCIGVVNFQRSVAQQIADGLAHIGGELGVPVDDETCTPNIIIVGASDGRALADQWVEREYRDFRPNISDASLSSAMLDRFRTTDAPVRWWAISRPAYYDVVTGRRFLTCCGPIRIPVTNKSLQAARTRDDLQRLVVILDVERSAGVSAEDLIAYLSMIVFSQVDMSADMTGHDTVLNLFAGSYGGAGLSDWDRAYLQSLYAAPSDLRINPHRQAGSLAATVREQNTPAD